VSVHRFVNVLGPTQFAFPRSVTYITYHGYSLHCALAAAQCRPIM